MKRLIVLVSLLWVASLLFSAAEPVVELQLNHIGSLTDSGTAISTTYGMQSSASVSLKSPNTGNVRGDVAFTLNYPEATNLLTIDRAYLRARFPQFRLTMGKTRTGWGDGVLFNAADLLFGSTGTVGVDLSAAELRVDTRWLTGVNIPFGPFTFVEALVIAPESLEPIDTEVGARLYTTIGSTKLEFGGAYREDTSGDTDTGKVFTPYAALQGHFGVDWYAASSVNIAYPAVQISDELRDSWIMSVGAYHMITVGYQGMLTARLEALVYPFGSWQESDDPVSYGLYLYPEVIFTPDDTWSFLLRSIICPIDVSAQITTGATWQVMQGFTLHGYATMHAGEAGDTFAWQSSISSVSLMLGASWIY